MLNRIRASASRQRVHLRCYWLAAVNRWRSRPLVGAAPVIVSLTSHGDRIDTVHLTIESIAAGTLRPARLILWLNAGIGTPGRQLAPALQRLVGRGLEVRFCDDYGPHTKYYPALSLALADQQPLVTADDDILYPRWWLQRLLAAHRRQPEVVWCHRARRVTVQAQRLGSYAEWDFNVACAEPSLLNFATGVSGVLYPLPVIGSLMAAGEGFRRCSFKQDDVWLHYVEVTGGHTVAQLGPHPLHFDFVPDSQHSALYPHNTLGGQNDAAISATYDEAARTILARAADAARAAP